MQLHVMVINLTFEIQRQFFWLLQKRQFCFLIILILYSQQNEKKKVS